MMRAVPILFGVLLVGLLTACSPGGPVASPTASQAAVSKLWQKSSPQPHP